MLTDRGSLDDALWLLVRRIAERVSAGEIDGAIKSALEINDCLENGFKSGTIRYDEAIEREIAVRVSLLSTIGKANTLLVFLGEYDARAARGDAVPPGREHVVKLLRARMSAC